MTSAAKAGAFPSTLIAGLKACATQNRDAVKVRVL